MNPMTRTSPVPLELPALRAVQPSRALRRLALVLVALFVVMPAALILAPWQQNVPASGRVTALDPLDRTQTIPAPVTGRLVELHVQEGSRVRLGDLIAVMSDQDPEYAQRLEQQRNLLMDKVQAARDNVEAYNTQLINLEDAREQAVSEALYEREVAVQAVRAAEQDLSAALAEFAQKRADSERKQRLFERRVSSELDFQRAQADSLAAEAMVEAARAKIEQARNKELASGAKINRVSNDLRAKIESTRSLREDARGKVAEAEKELTEATTRVERQKTQVVVAPRDGTILRVHAAATADLLSQGAPLVELIPETDRLAVELWLRGVDAPLVTPGWKVRLQFEGWPAVQFAGWPAVAVGTFGGVVALVDAQAGVDGQFRALVLPDSDEDEPWPDRRYLRQGVRANGWVLLDTVSLGYEMWRQLNAFPPSVRSAPEDTGRGEGAPLGKASAGRAGIGKGSQP